jgi:hypothetical protein
MKGQTLEKDIDLTATDGAATLEAQVQCRLSGQIRDFRLVMLNHGLILRGQVRTYYAKQVAQQAVMAATRWPILANEIEVF